jgi:DNA primase
MENNWVDFKAIKSAVTLRMVLDRYQINWLRKSGEELRGRCPIHQGEGQQSFHASLTKNAFNCFSCKARGNVLDFVAAMEKSSVRDAAMKLQEWFSIDPATAPTESKPDQKPAKKEKRGEGSEPVNKPLSFELKGIDHAHPYLSERGITKETAETFGVGLFSGRGSMNGRVVIPIHNERGELVAYAGRSIDGSEPRYKLPVGFHKSHVLFNLHRASSSNAGSEVIVVEGFFDCMKVWQAGQSSVVALMGSSLSEQQERLLLGRFKTVSLFMDGDDAGRTAAEEIAARLIRHMHVRIVEPPDGKQPDELDQEQLRALLG